MATTTTQLATYNDGDPRPLQFVQAYTLPVLQQHLLTIVRASTGGNPVFRDNVRPIALVVGGWNGAPPPPPDYRGRLIAQDFWTRYLSGQIEGAGGYIQNTAKIVPIQIRDPSTIVALRIAPNLYHIIGATPAQMPPRPEAVLSRDDYDAWNGAAVKCITIVLKDKRPFVVVEDYEPAINA